MKPKSRTRLITDNLITSGEEFNYFDTQLQLWQKELSKTRYDNQPSKWPLSGSWEYQFACSYLDKAERLLKEKKLHFNDENEIIREIRALFGKYENLKMFLLTLRIATITYRAGFIPELVQHGVTFSKIQSERLPEKRTIKGVTLEMRIERNQIIIDHFKKTRFTPNHFADKYAEDYKLSPRTVRFILSKAVGN